MIAILILFFGLIQSNPEWKFNDPTALCAVDSDCAFAEGCDGNPTVPLVLEHINFDLPPCEMVRFAVQLECTVTAPVWVAIIPHNEQGGLLQPEFVFVTPINGSAWVDFPDPVFTNKLMRDDFTVWMIAFPAGDYSFGIAVDRLSVTATPL